MRGNVKMPRVLYEWALSLERKCKLRVRDIRLEARYPRWMAGLVTYPLYVTVSSVKIWGC